MSSKSQIFFWLLIAFILGVAFASFVPPSMPLIWAVFVLGGTTAVFGALDAEKRKKAIIAGFAVMVFAFGLFWFARSSRAVAGLDRVSGERLTWEGMVDDEPVRTAKSQRVVVREKVSGLKMLVTTRQYPEYRYGDIVKISGKIEKPENFSDDFDYAAYLAKDDIFYVMSFPEIEVLERGRGSGLYRFLFQIKYSFSSALNRHLPEPHASFMAGLILGERKSFPPELTEKLQATGTTHLVALSGYNITIVADAFLKTLTFFFIPFSWAFGVAILGIMLFTMLTGAAASVVRAAIMGILVLVARREGRQYQMRNALALAAAAMLFVNPKILRFDAAFQLSFLATLGLVYVAPVFERGYEKIKLRFIPLLRGAKLIRESRDLRHRPSRKYFFRDVLVSTLSAQFIVLPLLVYNFGKLSLVGPLANVAVVPFIPATMFFGFVAGGAALVNDFLARVPAAAGWAMLHYELGAIDFFSRFSWASAEVRWLGPAVAVGLYFLIVFWLWREYKSKYRRKG
ncbi:MAG: ComEC family competence protein [Candidatus Sungbacteria bacterium]|uniref:ComEC family competence protein n=1 Tax=Candidatus Sungiibacteriota bacterium TaxID=2750080 RepID=A0A931SBK4_9BACT|nr:ComEC family competence protein [Candidatus Sungbacteria bacterium]